VNSEFTPGTAIRVAPGVQRLLAPNASPLTGPGTNSYLLGDPPVAVLDPGPAIPEHLVAIERCAPALETIFVTHTHPDHSPAARPLAMRTGARLIGCPPPHDGRQDVTFQPDQVPLRGQRFEIAGMLLMAIDTPGHASNHVCYLLDKVGLEGEGLLFSGDHVLDGVTPVILAPDGDMAAYLDSLRRLRELPLRAIAPGHGRILQDPIAVIDGVIGHRERREAKVLAVLGSLLRATLDELLPRVYDDVRRELHPLARLSLEAHLVKLEREGRCGREGATWLAS
jgi:glyoxylase-like metal-dependent hydrolase (beta-lactamase superfamily II)